MQSHPVWVRGLKLLLPKWNVTNLLVAPRVGAWIETTPLVQVLRCLVGRTPCGCVD